MLPYKISPYVSFVENRLIPGVVQYAVFHRLSGDLLQPTEGMRALLLALRHGNQISLPDEDLTKYGLGGDQLQQIIDKQFLIDPVCEPLTKFFDQFVTRPIQNPAISFQSENGDMKLVRTSMDRYVYSPRAGKLPELIEEPMSPEAAAIFSLADGSRTLREISRTIFGTDNDAQLLNTSRFREAVEFLTSQERQLIKFTRQLEDVNDPFVSANTVPRNLYHGSNRVEEDGSSKSVIDFHLSDIESASWEFDQLEATVNHSFRFPDEPLGGLDYGSRFCLATMQPQVVPTLDRSHPLTVLEVGGGTGTFAKSFITQAGKCGDIEIDYYILDLSPTLIQNQQKVLAEVLPSNRHFQQDATQFEIPAVKFDLIIANEVIADFPVALAQRAAVPAQSGESNDTVLHIGQAWQGEGASYLRKYDLSTTDAPDSFLVPSGTFQFIERCWEHLVAGGTLILSEYGSPQTYPVRAYHLNHEEFSIHFGHLKSCATEIGFECRLVTLKDFLSFDDRVPVLNGREEHILCLNHVLKKYGQELPFAVVSKSAFETQFQELIEKIQLTGFSFSPISKKYHFGPALNEFMVLILNKPR